MPLRSTEIVESSTPKPHRSMLRRASSESASLCGDDYIAALGRQDSVSPYTRPSLDRPEDNVDGNYERFALPRTNSYHRAAKTVR